MARQRRSSCWSLFAALSRLRTVMWFGAVSLVLLAPTTLVAQAPVIPADVHESVRARIREGISVGLVIALVDSSGVTYFAHGTRAVNDTIPVDEQSVYEIGSITKAFTGVLLAQMALHGELQLDDPIERYLPDVGVPSRGREITLRDLATHTSGLPRLPDNLTPADASNPYADYTVEQLHAFLGSHTLRRSAGAEYEYSNLGMGLLGYILARRAGMSYEALLRERILDPLGMASTAITLTPEMEAHLARGHSGGRVVSNWDIPTLAGAGGLRSTAADMVTFLQANIGLLETPLRGAMARSHADDPGIPGPVGLGWHVSLEHDVRVVWHNGGTGGYRTFAGFDPAKRRGAVVLSNSDVSADDIGFHLLDPARELTPVPVAGPLGAQGAASVDGHIRFIDSVVTSAESRGFSGILLIRSRNVDLLFRAYGWQDREAGRRMTVETGIEIGSIVKPLTLTALLRLEEMEKLSLTDSLSAFFPDAPADKRAITLEQIARHTAGFPDVFGGDYDPVSRDWVVAKVLNAPLLASPGEKESYSNSGYSLLAAIIEQRSGQAYEVFVREQVLRPAGVSRIGYVLAGWRSEDLAVGYRADGVRWGTPLDSAWRDDGPGWNLRGNGGMFATAAELMDWYEALYDGNVLGERGLAAFLAIDAGESRTVGGPALGHAGGNGIFNTLHVSFFEPDTHMTFFSSVADHQAEDLWRSVRDAVIAIARAARTGEGGHR